MKALSDQLPSQIVLFGLGAYLVATQWHPCDATAVAMGSSMILIVMGLALGLLVSMVQSLSKSKSLVNPIWGSFAFLFAGWLLICTIGTIGNGNARTAFLGFWQTVSILGVLVCMTHFADQKQPRTTMVRWLVALSIGASIYALYQYFVSMPATRDAFVQDKAAILERLGILPGTAEAMQFENRLFSSEPTGPFSLTNSLAGFVAPGILILIVLVVDMLGYSIKGHRVKQGEDEVDEANLQRFTSSSSMILVPFLIASAAVMYLSKSRTAWGAVLIGFAFVGWLTVRGMTGRARQGLIPVLFGSMVFVFLFAGLAAWRDPQLFTEAGKSLLYRMDYWSGAWKLASASPVVGYGPLSYQSLYATVKPITASENPADPHNLWMEVLVWGGFPFLFLCIAIVSTLSVVGWRAMNRDSTASESSSTIRHRLSALDVGGIAALMVVGGMSLFFVTVGGDVDSFVSAVLFAIATAFVAIAMQGRSIVEAIERQWMTISLVCGVVVLVHLFFSGGWMQPGSMNPLLLSVAGIAGFGKKRLTTRGKSAVSSASIVVWGLAAIGFGWTTLYPEMERNKLESLYSTGELTHSTPEQCRAQLQSNAWDPDGAEWLVRFSFSQINDQRLGDTARRNWLEFYDDAGNEWIRRDNRNWRVMFDLGLMDGMIADLFRLQNQQGPVYEAHAKACRSRLTRASELFPVSAQCQLQTAVVLAWLGENQKVDGYLDSVQKIDESTPHTDRKLSAVSVWVPQSLMAPNDPVRMASKLDSIPDYVKGEPIFAWLRKSPRQ